MTWASRNLSTAPAILSKGSVYRRRMYIDVENETGETGTFLRELDFADMETMARFAGNNDENLSEIEQRYPVSLLVRGNKVAVRGPDEVAVDVAYRLLEQLHKIASKGHALLLADVRYAMDMIAEKGAVDLAPLFSEVICTTARGKADPGRRPKGSARILKPFGTTMLFLPSDLPVPGRPFWPSVMRSRCSKPRRSAGSCLYGLPWKPGRASVICPATFGKKLEPYVRPLYDAFYDLLSPERFLRYVDKGVIEIAPLAYMRGRTLNDSFIILDEAQNTTPEQMKMFLTRLGFGSKAVITGDITQIDLPNGKKSGLIQVRDILEGIEGIEFFKSHSFRRSAS